MSVFDNLLDWDNISDAEENPYQWDALKPPSEFNIIADADTLYQAMKDARRGTGWKTSVQKFCWSYLPRLSRLQAALVALENGTDGAWEPGEGYDFLHNERGRMRAITGQIIDDRVASHALNDAVLLPAIRPHLIYDNSASLKGRGVDMARKRLRVHLERFAQREGTDAGYIRLKDESKYYDNVRYRDAYDILAGFTDNQLALKMVAKLLIAARTDISDLSEEERAEAMGRKFDRIAWRSGNHSKRGEAYLYKGLHVGDQLSQTIGIVYPYRVDNEATIVHGSRYYHRYMDDSRDLDRDLEKLRRRAEAIDRESENLGMFINERKTVICRTDKWFIWLQRKNRLRGGRLESRILPKAVHRINRRIRKLRKKMDQGARGITPMYVAGIIRSWTRARRDVLSYPQLRGIELNIKNLFGEEAYQYVYDHDERWKPADWLDD